MLNSRRVGETHQLVQVVSDLFYEFNIMVGFTHPTEFFNDKNSKGGK